MKNLIKDIRKYVGLSQEDFAERLGVAFATINRWENGKVEPNNLAQDKLYVFCKDNNVPVFDVIIKKIKDEIETINLNGNRMVLYHGSKSGIVGDIAPISRDKCDFGSGFYMGTDPMQPLTLICDYEKAKFYVVSVPLDGLEKIEIPANLDWAMIVAYNRGKMDEIKGTNLYEKYDKLCKGKDIVIGNIADDRMFYVIDNFFMGNITDLALIKSLSALQLGRQYVAISQKACDVVRIEKEIPISYLEKKILQDVSEMNRAKGILFAKDICKEYRREGKYFDELIDEAKEIQ